MEFVTGLFALFVAWLAGFFGHVVAHDFCEVTPMISSKIVEAAASKLPANIRERYREEWKADLHDQPGTIAKLSWAIGCWLSTRRVAREASREFIRRHSYQFILSDGVTITCDVPTLANFVSVMRLMKLLDRIPRWLQYPILPLFGLACRSALVKDRFEWRGCGAVDLAKVVAAVDAALHRKYPPVGWLPRRRTDAHTRVRAA